MKKNKKDLVANVLRLVTKIEALHTAGIELPYFSFSTYGGNNYLTCDFTFGDFTFKLKLDEEVDWESLKAVEKAVDDIKDAAIKDMEAAIAVLELFKEA